MTTSAFTLAATYTAKAGDWIVLPWKDGKAKLFDASLLPKGLEPGKAPEKEGGGRTVFAGKVGRTALQARAVRLDTPHRSLTDAAATMVRSALSDAKKEGAKRVVVLAGGPEESLPAAVQEGTLLGGYAFDTYLEKKASPLPVLLVTGKQAAALRKKLKNQAAVLQCVNFARDVLNEPPNAIQPPSLADAFRKEGKAAGLKVTVWDEKRLARERCGGILGVGQGSAAKPRLVMGEYAPRGAKKHLALVGKGVTFDSGGYCLKPSASQVGMKYDMGGAAMMFAAACAIARTGLKLKVTVVTPLAENAVSGEAYHTTSILTTRAGRTVEVHNTDAEGRLILADALDIAQEKEPDWLIDAATLTGACVVALGEDVAGAYGTDPDFTERLLDAGARADECFWQLPLHRAYEEQLKSTVADCKNIGGKWGGSITAALFLKKWVRDGLPWIHLDIAGPGIKDEPLGSRGKGAKGFGVKTVVALAEALA